MMCTTYTGLLSQLDRIVPPQSVIIISCLGGIINLLGSRQEPKEEMERAMSAICQSLHSLIGKFPNTRVYISQPSPRLNETFKVNSKFAVVSNYNYLSLCFVVSIQSIFRDVSMIILELRLQFGF